MNINAQLPAWFAWVFYTSALLVSLFAILKAVRVFMKTVNKIDKLLDLAGPITEMGKEFKKNGGSSLRDTIDRIEKATAQAVSSSTATAEKTEAVAAEAQGLRRDVQRLTNEVARLMRRNRGNHHHSPPQD
ncbi:MAG: hypothetical protein KGL39_52595 [Patescibacteria group bacterium]|nr:hypothetical protein [Patescibacteria group bacterium]